MSDKQYLRICLIKIFCYILILFWHKFSLLIKNQYLCCLLDNKMKEKQFDIDAFERLYREQYTRLYYFAYDFVGDIEVGKDIVSEAFTKLWKGRESLNTDKVEGFLFMTVRNDCIKYLRRKKTDEKYLAYCLASMKEEDESTLSDIDDRMAEIQTVLKKMPARTRFVVEECCYNDRSYKEVAEILQITTHGVKKHIVKGFAQLREHFNVKKKK